jgi:hypothetical protein
MPYPTTDYSDNLGDNHELSGTQMVVSFDGVPESDLVDVTVKEVMLGESLLTPGLQTSIKFDSYIHTPGVKWFDHFKNAIVYINIEKPGLSVISGLPTTMDVAQRVYRMDSRHLVNNNNERFTLRACDDTQLTDPATLVSKSWKCETPSDVVRYVLDDCAKAKSMDVEDSDYARDYIAENIHPFQVVSQQANYALADGSDPSFLHYMTYEDGGTHKFRSLYSLSRQSPVMSFFYNEVNNAYADPRSILTYSFPCDFDLMSDILNGIDANGNDINSLILFDPINKSFSMVNSEWGDDDCGIGSGLVKMAITNENTAQQQDMCPDYVKQFLQKRQARMGLLEKDKIALRLTVPFNPILHAGSTIYVNLYNKETGTIAQPNYGTGTYMILHMFHHIIEGGFSTTTMDCVSNTVGYKYY